MVRHIFNLTANVLEINLESALGKEIGFQFSMKPLCTFFIKPYDCLFLGAKMEFKNGSTGLAQKVS